MCSDIATAVADIESKRADPALVVPRQDVAPTELSMPGHRNITYADFFSMCERIGLHEGGDIAAAFLVSEQTVSNWRKRAREHPCKTMPGWVGSSWYAAACLGDQLEEVSRERMPGFPVMTIDWFKGWQQRHGLSTYYETGLLFRVSRQAVHNWFCRNRFPTWISRACIGHDILMENGHLPGS